MHIVALVAALLGGAAVWYWRLQVLRDAGSEVSNTLGRLRGAMRMRKFRQQANASVLNTVDDPALAAAVFMFALANEGERRPGTVDDIRERIAAIVPAEMLDETMTYAEWAARDVVDSRDCVRKFKPLWRSTLEDCERADLVAMAEDIVGPSPDHQQKLSLQQLRLALVT